MCLFKPAKDQNKPKRPMTSFLFFLEQYREIKKAEGLKGPEVSKQAGEEWRCMPGEKKKKYLDLQEKAKEKFDEEMKEWIAKVNMAYLVILLQISIIFPRSHY